MSIDPTRLCILIFWSIVIGLILYERIKENDID